MWKLRRNLWKTFLNHDHRWNIYCSPSIFYHGIFEYILHYNNCHHNIWHNCLELFCSTRDSSFLIDVLTVAFAFNRVVFVDLTKTKNISKMKNDNATFKYFFVILVLYLWFLSFYAAICKYVLIFYGTIQFRGQFSRDI